MAAALNVVLLLACAVYSCDATCSNFPIRLPGTVLETASSDPTSPTCPSASERQATLDLLDRDLEELIARELSVIQSLTSPIDCPGSGWRKVVDFNLEADSSLPCPGGWVKDNTNGVPHCRRSEGGYCQMAAFDTEAVNYREVCGRVKGFQVGRPTGFFASAIEDTNLGLDASYLDGVSITRSSLSQHIWSFAAGTSSQTDPLTADGHFCPCLSEAIADQVIPPSFIGSNYFCDSGTDERSTLRQFYPDNPLWDGQGCLDGNGCCERGPYFYRNMTTSTCNDLEVRICTSNDYDLINIGVSIIELYVK